MPSPIQYILPKTEDSKEFEKMVAECASIRWQQQFFLYGRRGQKQHGIDIFSEKWDIVIQCKNYMNNMSIEQFITNVKRDYETAVNRFTKIRKFVIATALNRDAKLQDAVRDISTKNNSQAEINITILFWEDIQETISSNQNLIDMFYPRLCENVSIFTANKMYAESFCETLFLHKHKDDKRVNLVNLFIMQKYEEYGDTNIPEKYSLPKRIIHFIRNEKYPFLFIEGNAGCGKSSFVAWLNYHVSRHEVAAQRVLEGRPLITIRLRDLDRDLIRSDKSLVEAILKYMNINDVDDLEKMFPRAIMLLDGFDELCMIDGIDNYEDLIYKFQLRGLSDFKFIITTRPKYIKNTINVQHKLLTLKHFDSQQRAKWLERYTEKCGQKIEPEVRKYIENIDDDAASAICDTPMTLYMLVAKNTSKEMMGNSWKLYHHIFYKELTETEYNQMFHNPNRNYAHDIVNYRDIVYRINEEIAYRMYCSKNRKFYLTSNEIQNIITQLSNHKLSADEYTVKKLTEHCYALCTYWKARSSDGAVEFYHNNIRDFFLCEKIFREINDIYENESPQEDLKEALSQKLCELFKFGTLETMACQFILLRTYANKSNCQNNFPFIENSCHILPELFEYMLTNGKIYNNLNVINPIQAIINILTCTAQIYRHIYEPYLDKGDVIKWWNLPTLINEFGILKYVFAPIFTQVPITCAKKDMLTMASKGDFSKINFSGYDLRNIGFQESVLRGTIFSNAILCGCDFSNTKLEQANFMNADMHYSSLEEAIMKQCNMDGADLRGTKLPDGSCSEDQDAQIERMKLLNISGLTI